MNLLLDTHVFLWWLRDDRRLGDVVRAAIADPGSGVYVSAAAIWEASVKIALGRLDVEDANLVDEIEENGFRHLPVAADHAWLAGALPRHHDDPFDRMFIAQATIEGLVLVTSDAKFDLYEVASLRA